ncbi:HlyD family efflux transporter periplasmic adaptor subunit [uncultured Alistipes sp.]|uniref:efflux RND transporter periplasmic adaptor subunit n=1 Tax=uncultured Alistipes sp. TaxID=538949 RepID=UPI003209FFB1
MQSKERHALGSNENLIDITAERDGIVLDVQAQPGSYAAEGTTLCTLVEAASLVFEINVPYEQRAYAGAGSRCTLELPDGAHLTATVQSPLAVMNTASQSERVVAIAEAPFLPEGMNVKAIFTSRNISEGITVLPKSAVQSDETLTEHWVMRLAKDSTAEKVPVSIGNSTTDSIEILSPILSPGELIVATGGYGLTDGARVAIIQ